MGILFFIFLCAYAYLMFSFLERIGKDQEAEEKEQQWVEYMEEYAMGNDHEINSMEAQKALCLFLKSIGHEKIVEQYEESMNQAST